MEILPIPNDIVDQLSQHRTLGAAPREELAWIAAHAQMFRFHRGEMILDHEKVAEGLHILMSGRLSLHINRGGGWRKAMEWRGGEVTGVLPYSRLVHSPGDTFAEEEVVTVSLQRNDMPQLIIDCPQATAIMVHVMLDRARAFRSNDLHDEKMLSMGKLASGLAHELNNPASAAARSAKLLATQLDWAESAGRAIGAAQLTEQQLAALDSARTSCLLAGPDRVLSAVERSDREDMICDWLESHGADTQCAEALTDSGASIDVLNHLAGAMQGPALNAALRWIATGCSLRALARDVETATARIHNLVNAVKGFTYMDREAVAEPVDIARGLANTFSVLEGKASAKSVRVTIDAEPDLPQIHGFGSEMNQIWEHLIDNAIDAVSANGHVAVSAAQEQGLVVVRVADDGPGIPADIRDRIFDPFFTTKEVGQGTGLGLDIVNRLVRWHDGEITVDSEPGRTVFRVNLPVSRMNVAR